MFLAKSFFSRGVIVNPLFHSRFYISSSSSSSSSSSGSSSSSSPSSSSSSSPSSCSSHVPIVDLALLCEKDGVNFFRFLADKSSNDFCKSLFSRLAKEEEKHLLALENMFFSDDSMLCEDEESFQEAKEIFSQLQNYRYLFSKAEGDETKFFVLAREFEEKCRDGYMSLAKEAKSPKIKVFFNNFAADETNNYNLLKSVKATFAELDL